jgi:protein TonB
MKQKDEKKYNRIGMFLSIGIHGVLLLLFFFTIAWRLPNPPPPGLPGMEINIGFEDAGMGDEQTSSDEVLENEVPEEIQQELAEEAIISEEKLMASAVESPYEIKAEDPQKEVKEKKDATEKKNQTTTTTKNTNTNAQNLFPGRNSDSDGDKNTKGDQGRPDGNPDSRNMYPGGKGGNEKGAGPGGNGASMDMPGWVWDSKPDKQDPTSESGFVAFEFYVDELGNVIGVTKIDGANLTPSEDNFYRKQLEETTFHMKDTRAKPQKRTKGVFRFDVRSR